MNSNGTELERVVHTHRTGAVGREGLVNWIPFLAPQYILPSQWISVVAPTYSLPLRSEYLFTLRQTVAQNLSDIWRSTLEIGAAHLRSVTEIALKSPFSCVNRSPIWYDSRALARAILCNENFIFFLFISCQIPSAAFPKVRRRFSWRVR